MSKQDLTTTVQSPDSQPTLENQRPAQSEQPYSAFTGRQKWLLVALVSVAATFSGFASNIYFPALPTIAFDLHVSVTDVNLTVTTYMIFQGLAPSLWGAISDVKGRRITYLCTFLVFLAACIGLANTRNYATLLILRCLQSTGSASTIALGSGVIGDLTTRAERGGFMGVYQTGLLVPTAVGPIIGGAMADTLGWKAIFWFLAIYSGAFVLVLFFVFPETLRSIVGNGSRTPKDWLRRFPLAMYQKFQLPHDGEKNDSTKPAPKKSIDLLGPVRILVNRQAILWIGFVGIYYAVWQMSITVMSTLFASIYHLNETNIGLTFIGNGVGNMVGTLVQGKILDAEYRRAKTKFDSEQRGESQTAPQFPIERARLRLLPLFASMECASILTFGWTLQYRTHIAAPIVSTFFTGWAANSIQSTVTTYLVDIFHDQSASAGAALNLVRCLTGAVGTAVATPMIDGLGVGPCFTLLTGLMLLGLLSAGVQAFLKRTSRQKHDRNSDKR